MASNDEVIKHLRSILTTRKGPATLREIRLDYLNLMGENIRESLLETLMRNNRSDFDVVEKDGVKYFNARVKESSEHITRLVSSQKAAPKKKPRASAPRAFNQRQYTRPTPTAYSQYYASKPRYPLNQISRKPINRNNSYNNNTFNRNSNINSNNFNSNKAKIETDNKLPEIDLRHKLQQAPRVVPLSPLPREISAPPAPPPTPVETIKANFQQTRPIQNYQSTTQQPKTTAFQQKSSQKELPDLPKLQINNLTNRLNKNRELKAEDLMAAKEYEQRVSSTPTTATSPVNWDLESLDDFKKLEYYCKLNNFAPPNYKILKTKCTDEIVQKKKIEFNGLVTVSIFSVFF